MPKKSSTTRLGPGLNHRSWVDVLLGLGTGALGGALQSTITSDPITHGVLLGGLFGLIFSFLCATRTRTPGAGLIWGLGGALFLWYLAPVELLVRASSFATMLSDTQARFPQLVGYLVCLGMPVGVALGIRGAIQTRQTQPQFRWARAIVAGGLAGTISGLAFSGWEYAGGYLPLLQGLPEFQSQTTAVTLHFVLALLIGAIFGILFQRDVRGYGSSMGWGLGFGIFLWFFGPLTLFPVFSRLLPDWSADQGAELFGALIGYIIYGFILGTVYAFLDQIWVRLFIQSDPLNREPEGPGFHFLRSIEWGALAGLVGGLVSIPVSADSFAVNSDRSLRLASERGRRSVSFASGTPNLWRDYRVHVPFVGTEI
jgi:MFS family permease